MDSFSIPLLARELASEADAYEFLEELRWQGRVVCPHCGSLGEHYFLRSENCISRRTRTGARSERRIWKCQDCRKQFSVLTGTVLHGTKVALRTWVLVMFEMCASKNGIAAREIERKYRVSPKTAWFMSHRVRQAMALPSSAQLFSGIVVADETWIGGEPKNHHDWRNHKGTQGHTDKAAVFSLVSVATHDVRSTVVDGAKARSLRPFLTSHVATAETTLHTDSANYYIRIGREMAAHRTVDHHLGEYVRDGVSTNQASDSKRMARLIGQLGSQRLLYR